MNDQPANDSQLNSAQANSYVDDYVPPTSTNPTVSDDSKKLDEDAVFAVDQTADDVITNQTEEEVENSLSGEEDNSDAESLESQNIFIMLGVEDGSEELKEKFLDQLQEVIWEDFLSNDVELLLTTSEMPEFEKLKAKRDEVEGDAQERAQDQLVEYLEKLIPDLEDIMLEKALDLKADLFTERISGMKELFAGKEEQLKTLSQAESLMFEDKWMSSAKMLNKIQE